MMSDNPSPPRFAVWAGVVFLALSLGGCGFGCTRLVSTFSEVADSVSGLSSTRSGETLVYQATTDGALLLTSSESMQCQVSDPAGQPVELKTSSWEVNSSDSSDDGLVPIAAFATEEGSQYSVTCSDPAGTEAFSAVAFPNGITTLIGSFLAGVLFLVVGGVLLIVGLVRRARWKKSFIAPGGFPGASGPPLPGQGPSSSAPPGGFPPPPPGGFPPPPPGGFPPPPPPGGLR